MTGQTPKYGIKYPTGADKVKNIPTTMQEAATTTEAAITAGVNEMAGKVQQITGRANSVVPTKRDDTFTFASGWTGTIHAFYRRGKMHIELMLKQTYASASTPPPDTNIKLADTTSERVAYENYLQPCIMTTNGGKDNLSNKVAIMVTGQSIYLKTLDSIYCTGVTTIWANFDYIISGAYQS